MDRATILKHIAQAEGHVISGEQHISQQRAIVAGLKSDGHSAVQAEGLLRTFLDSQVLHEQDLARLRIELRDFDRGKFG